MGKNYKNHRKGEGKKYEYKYHERTDNHEGREKDEVFSIVGE